MTNNDIIWENLKSLAIALVNAQVQGDKEAVKNFHRLLHNSDPEGIYFQCENCSL